MIPSNLQYIYRLALQHNNVLVAYRISTEEYVVFALVPGTIVPSDYAEI